MAKHKEGDIRLRSSEPEPVSIVREVLVPRSWCLLEPIERLVEPTHVLGVSQVDEARRLLTVDLFVEIAMEKSILDVKLMYRPPPRGSDAEDDPDGGRFDNGTKCLIEVDPGLLREASNDPPRLVSRESTGGVELMLEDPLA